MGLLDSILAADAQAFADPDLFGEPVTYTPKGGAPVAVNAVVYRLPPTLIPGTASVAAPSIEVFVPRGVAGIVALDKDGDRITVAARIGDAPKPHPIAEIVSQDAGGYMLRLR